MTLLEQILEQLDGDAPVREVMVGSRCSAVWSRDLGLAFHFGGRCHRTGQSDGPVELPPGLDHRSARRMAELARSDDPLRASIGVAAINSLCRPDPDRVGEGDAFELVTRRGAGRRVAVVGHFPFVERLRPLVRRLDVLELRPRDGDLHADEAPRIIPQCDVLAITGATLVNHTLDRLLELAAGKFVVLLGPTTVFSPVLFDHGVSAICGSLVTDPAGVLEHLAAGKRVQSNPAVRKVIWTAPDDE